MKKAGLVAKDLSIIAGNLSNIHTINYSLLGKHVATRLKLSEGITLYGMSNLCMAPAFSWFTKSSVVGANPMFKSFKKAKQEPSFVYDQAVILNIDLDSRDEFGTEDERNEVLKLEEIMRQILPEKSGIDGHEFGDGEAVMYIYGPSADDTFASIKSALEKSAFSHINVTLQYGLPDDPKTKDKKFTL